jgi:hypothetical protein
LRDRGRPTTATRHAFPLVTTTDALQAILDDLDNAGSTIPVGDSIDTRIVNDVRQRTGQILTDPSQVSGFPTLSSGPLPQDTDHDVMPDIWELAHGFNPENDADGRQDVNGNGYTNLEEYLNDTPPVNGDVTPPHPPTGLKALPSSGVIKSLFTHL